MLGIFNKKANTRLEFMFIVKTPYADIPLHIFVTYPCLLHYSIFAVIPMPWISGY